MATADQIKALVESSLSGDDDRAMTVALQIAAHAARKGQRRFASELRDLVDHARDARSGKSRSGTTRPVPIAMPKGELEGLLGVSFPGVRLSDMVLGQRIRDRLTRIVVEYRAREKLSHHSLHPRRKLLLVGPPGCGKTMTASALAGELQLPLLVIKFDGLITKFMGETSAKLRLIFDSMFQTRGVYLFDEFDAIGGHRGLSNDVGEIRRVLNAFLQFIERDESDSLIVAATNFADDLDRALFRRFDDMIVYDWPSNVEARALMESYLAPFDAERVDFVGCAEAAVGLSYADIARACEDAAKVAVLGGELVVSTASLREALLERKSMEVGQK